jgi:hypothetical protein
MKTRHHVETFILAVVAVLGLGIRFLDPVNPAGPKYPGWVSTIFAVVLILMAADAGSALMKDRRNDDR